MAPPPTLAQRAAAELLGTAFLVATVIGSGIAAQRLSPHDIGLQLLENSLATGAVLVAMILALQPVSASFNPVVTLVERALGRISSLPTVALIAAQVVGGVVGAIVANLMFDLDAVSISGHDRVTGGHLMGEVVATLGLVIVVFGALRSPRIETVAFAVGGYIAAAYWFTSSTSFANPAVTIARMLSDTFAGIAPGLGPAVRAHAARRRRARRRSRAAPAVSVHPPCDLRGAAVTSSAEHARPTVLFVCVHNAGRSQMAAGYLQHLAGDRVDVLSAGSQPADQVNPVAVAAMAEDGIDLTHESPKLLTEAAVLEADVVVTMGCGDECPYYPGKRYEDWVLDDPAGQGIDVVRPIRDEIRHRVESLLAELLP